MHFEDKNGEHLVQQQFLLGWAFVLIMESSLLTLLRKEVLTDIEGWLYSVMTVLKIMMDNFGSVRGVVLYSVTMESPLPIFQKKCLSNNEDNKRHTSEDN
ncbi:MAG: hypothetical protein IPL22_22435 [Bacteroidetes bacterium]|nr:hypothetical protein [Bacteroidota bacterium]